MPDEAELLQLARQFDRRALAQVYDLYSPGLYSYALRQLSDPSLAEDCVAETFKRLLQVLASGRGPGAYLRAYLYRTAHNWIVDQYRGQSSPSDILEEDMLDGGSTPEEQAGLKIQQERLRQALKRLTPDQQQVVVLKYIEGWSNEEIAQAIKKPVGAVKSLQHRGLVRLQRLLDDEEI